MIEREKEEREAEREKEKDCRGLTHMPETIGDKLWYVLVLGVCNYY